jgi:hypothetical protein
LSFLVFEQFTTEAGLALRPTGDYFKLAGRNLLYQAWKRMGKPLNKGWHISRGDLLDLHFGGTPPMDARLIIDFHPTADGRIGLIEPLDTYGYTFGDDGRATWTPLMLRLHDVFYKEYDVALTPEGRAEIMNRVPTNFEGQETIEFLYLNGDDKGWNWGRNGMTNAAFLQGGARDYFRQFF